MLRLLIELLPALALGFWLGRQRPLVAQRLAAPLVRFGVPLSVMGLLLKAGLNPQMLQAAGIAVVAIGLMQLMLWGIPLCRRTLRQASNTVGSCVGNTAYVGIPVTLALLPPEALPISIGYDLGATLLTWSVGPLLLSQHGDPSGRHPLRLLAASLGSSPAVRGLLGALILTATPWSQTIATLLWLPSQIVILLALAVVGMRLGAISVEQQTPRSAEGLQAAILIKLVIYPAVMLAITASLQLSALMVQALTLQAAAPTAISILLIAEAVRHNQAIAARLVLRTTLMAAISTPIWGWILTAPH